MLFTYFVCLNCFEDIENEDTWLKMKPLRNNDMHLKAPKISTATQRRDWDRNAHVTVTSGPRGRQKKISKNTNVY